MPVAECMLSEKNESKIKTCLWMKTDLKWLWLKFWWRVHLKRKISYFYGIRFLAQKPNKGTDTFLWTLRISGIPIVSNTYLHTYNLRKSVIISYLTMFPRYLTYRINLINLISLFYKEIYLIFPGPLENL